MIKAVIFDWAGTTVDYGCQAPPAVLVSVFSARGITLLPEESRHAMGLPKKDQIRAICGIPRIHHVWTKLHKTEPDVDALYKTFVPAQLESITEHSDVIDGIPAVIGKLRAQGIRIGSTTGYTREMLNLILPKAALQGYAPDVTITPSETGEGRPAPWMIFENLRQLGVYPPNACIKVGDTPVDIEEGLNAGLWTVGVAASSNEAVAYGLDGARNRLRNAGAHYVIDRMEELIPVIDEVGGRMALS